MASIEGTATYHHIEVTPRPDDDSVEVTGVYNENQTTYLAEDVYVSGLRIEPEGAGTIVMTGDDWVWVDAREEAIHIFEEKPEDA